MSREFDELLSAYLDGEVSPEERAAVERRLEQSPALRETLDELSEVGDLIRGLPRARAPIDLPERVVSAISTKPLVSSAQPRKRNRLFGVWPLMTAGTVLAAGVAIVVLMPLGRKNAENQVALESRHAGAAPATAAGMPVRGLAEAVDNQSRTALAAENAGATDAYSFGTNLETKSLSDSVIRLGRRPMQGEVLRNLQDNAGNTKVLVYTVVDTREVGPTLKTIFLKNNLDLVETETQTPRGGVAAAPDATDRFVYFVEGPEQQIVQTLDEIESLPVRPDIYDLGLLAADSEPIQVELFDDRATKPEDGLSLTREKEKADQPVGDPAPAPARRYAAPRATSDFSLPSVAPASPAPVTNGFADGARAKEAQLGDRVELKVGEAAARPAALAPAQASAVRGEVERLSTSNAPQTGNAYLGVSAQIDSNAPIVEEVMRTRFVGNSIQGNALQWNDAVGNSVQRNSLQRQPAGQPQQNFFRSRSQQRSLEPFDRKADGSVVDDVEKKLNESKGAVLKQQMQNAAGRPAAETVRDLDSATVANPGNVPSQEEGLVRALIILEARSPEPAAAPTVSAPKVAEPKAPEPAKKAGD